MQYELLGDERTSEGSATSNNILYCMVNKVLKSCKPFGGFFDNAEDACGFLPVYWFSYLKLKFGSGTHDFS